MIVSVGSIHEGKRGWGWGPRGEETDSVPGPSTSPSVPLRLLREGVSLPSALLTRSVRIVPGPLFSDCRGKHRSRGRCGRSGVTEGLEGRKVGRPPSRLRVPETLPRTGHVEARAIGHKGGNSWSSAAVATRSPVEGWPDVLPDPSYNVCRPAKDACLQSRPRPGVGPDID